MFCRQCGNELKDWDRFCQICGAEVKKITENGTVILPKSNVETKYVSGDNGNKTTDIKKEKRFLPWILAGGIFIAIIIVVIVGVTVFGSSQKKYDRQLALGAQYLDELNYEKAVAIYKAMLDVDPKNGEVLELLEKTYIGWAESEPDRASDIYGEAIEYIGSLDGKQAEQMAVEFRDRITQAENTDIAQASADTEATAAQETTVYTVSLSVISAATEEPVGGTKVSIQKSDNSYSDEKETEENGKAVISGLDVGQYTIKTNADGFNGRELTVNIEGDKNILLAMAPVMNGNDACVLMEWDGEMDVDLCAFNAKLKEYVNSSRVMDSEGNMFLYDINKADEGFELLYIHNIGSEEVKTIYVLDRVAAQAGASSSLEADGVRVYIYTSDGEVFHSTAISSQNAPLWAPCYIYAGEVYDLGDYITDLSDYQWISTNVMNSKNDHRLYDAFSNNEEKVLITSDGDEAQYYELCSYLKEGNYYTLDEIVKSLKGDATTDVPEYKYIDCGLDGIDEMLVTIIFHDVEDFEFQMVIKEINGKLKLCYDCDSWSRSQTYISDSGYITGRGSGGAAAYGFWESYIDKDGRWRSWNTGWVEGDYLLEWPITIGNNSIDISDINYGSLALYEYVIDDKSYYMFDEYGNAEGNAESAGDINALRKRFQENGVKLYDYNEINEILEQKRVEIGLTIDIIDYDS